MNYLDGFSGYGGFHLGLEQAGFKFDKVYYSEIDKYAIANYKYNFPESIYAGSITDIPTNGTIEKLDLFTFGWPCQDNSIAGKRKGQTRGTRSGLLYSAIEIINKYKPRLFIAENVRGLLSVNKGIDIVESFKLLAYLNECCPQYDIEMQLLNTRWFLPQNRERLYFVGHLRTGTGTQKIFPIGESNTTVETEELFYSQDCISGTINQNNNSPKGAFDSGSVLVVDLNTALGNSKTRRGGISNKVVNTLDTSCNHGLILSDNYQRGSQGNRVYNVNGNSQTLNSQGGGQGAKTGLYEIDGNVRRLTPIECERLQGLPEDWTRYGLFEKQVWINKKKRQFEIVQGKKELADSSRYKLIGNGVSIPVVKEIGKALLKNLNGNS